MRKILLITVAVCFMAVPSFVEAHSGRTDSSGGHNCRTGSCAGTYHYHNGGYSRSSSYSAPSYATYSNYYGLSKSDVRIIQNFLNEELGRSMVVDGIYGSNTKSAVRAFQYKHGLVTDGIVGSRTIAKMIDVADGTFVKSNANTTSRSTASCNSNYSGCVPIASDVDCAGGSGDGPKYVRGPIRVTGYDVYGLDRDNDGIACE